MMMTKLLYENTTFVQVIHMYDKSSRDTKKSVTKGILFASPSYYFPP